MEGGASRREDVQTCVFAGPGAGRRARWTGGGPHPTPRMRRRVARRFGQRGEETTDRWRCVRASTRTSPPDPHRLGSLALAGSEGGHTDMRGQRRVRGQACANGLDAFSFFLFLFFWYFVTPRLSLSPPPGLRLVEGTWQGLHTWGERRRDLISVPRDVCVSARRARQRRKRVGTALQTERARPLLFFLSSLKNPLLPLPACRPPPPEPAQKPKLRPLYLPSLPTPPAWPRLGGCR